MRKIRQLLLVTLVVCAWPMVARAQWATSRTEHDWRLNIAGHSFGLVQEAIYTVSLSYPNYRTTTIYLGPYTTTTRVPAAYAAVMMLLPAGTIGFLLLTRLLAQRRGA